MLRLPLALVGLGVAMTAVESIRTRWVTADWLLVGELLLVAATGTVMGRATRFRSGADGLKYRLRASGLLLWFAFLGIRLGVFALAARLGADILSASGLVLLSFGVNRLAATLVVRRRALRHDVRASSTERSPVGLAR